MELEGSLPPSQEPAICPYPEPDQSSPAPSPTSWISTLISSSHWSLWLSTVFLSRTFQHQIPVYTFPLPYVLHALFYLITCIIFGEEYRSQSSSLCNLLQSSVASSLLGPSILLSTPFSNAHGLYFSLRLRDKISFAVHNNRKYGSSACFRFCSFFGGCEF